MTKRCPAGTHRVGSRCMKNRPHKYIGSRPYAHIVGTPAYKKNKICKTINKDILEEHDTGFKHYPSLAKKLDDAGKIYHGGIVLGMAQDEKRHEQNLRKIRKSMGCR